MSDILASSADIAANRSGGSEVSPASSFHLGREWLYRALLVMFIALAFARGVYRLGFNSLWWDESLSLQRANYDLPDILSNKIILTDAVRQVITLDNHPPLYFLLLHFVVKLAGQSEFALRFPSLAFSVLTVSLLYTVGKHLFDRRAGLLAALLGAISPLYLWYSHEARMYTMLTFWGLLSFYTLLTTLTLSTKRETSNVKYLISNIQLPLIYVLSSAAMVTTHYLGFLVLLAELGIFLSFLRRNTWRRVAIPVLVVLLIAVPILYYGLSILPEGEMAGFRFIPLLELLRDVANSFSLGISVQAEKVWAVHWVFRGVFLIGALAAGWKAFRPHAMAPQSGAGQAPNDPWSPKAVSALLYLLVPVFSIYLLSYFRPAYMNIRHLIMVSPAFYLILALGLATISQRWRLIFASCLVLMVAGSAHATQQYFYNEKYAKDDHRAWGEYLKAHAQPGDVIVVDPPHIARIYQYYADAGLPWIGLPRLVSPEEVTISTLRQLMAQYDRIWLALSHTPPWGDPEFLPKKWLEEHAFLVDDRGFHSYASLVQIFCFLTSSPVLNSLPEIQHPLTANFEDKLIFLGYDLKGKPVTSGQFVHLNLYWKAPPTFGELREDYVVSLRLRDGENRLWGQADRRPLNGHYPTSQWQPGQIIKDDYEFLVDVGTPPGWYRLEMVVHNGNRPLTVVGEGSIPQGMSVNMGNLQVGKPTSPPTLATLPVEHRRVKDFGDLQLLGYDLTTGSYRPGDWVWVRPYWRAKRKLAEDYSFYLRLLDEHKGLWAQKVIRPVGDGYPTSFWDEGEVVKGQHTLRIPPDAPAGEYYVEILLREPEVASLRDPLATFLRAVAYGGYALDLGKIRVLEIEREFAVPPIQHPHQANLGGRVEFLGYDLARTEFSPGEAVPLTLYWRALEQMQTSYTVFTHLVGEDNRIWGQQDNPPREGQHPTTLWVEGEVVTDSYNIPIKSDAPPGEYVIEIGLYNVDTGARLPVVDARGERIDDRILLQKIRVMTN